MRNIDKLEDDPWLKVWEEQQIERQRQREEKKRIKLEKMAEASRTPRVVRATKAELDMTLGSTSPVRLAHVIKRLSNALSHLPTISRVDNLSHIDSLKSKAFVNMDAYEEMTGRQPKGIPIVHVSNMRCCPTWVGTPLHIWMVTHKE